MESSLYHSLLRVCALTTALVLLFVSGIVHPLTAELTHNAERYVASVVGASAAVEATELNQITLALTELERREADLRERELAVGIAEQGQSTTDLSSFILSALLFILLVLIVLNYILDYLRQYPPVPPRQQPAVRE
jgi:hypothetical protein